MKQYRFTSAALTELKQATLYYEERENGLGTAFLDEVDATINRILQHPLLGISCPHERDAVELIAFRLA
jgi:plasmid stabilization system protein ParE